MTIHTYGETHSGVILLLHGGGLSWWNHREAAKLLARDHHVLLPVLDGHADSGHAFTSIAESARRILDEIDAHYQGHILAIGGLSLGAQVAVEILAQRPDVCRYALIESAALIPDMLTNRLIQPTFSASYPLIRQRWFAQLQFTSLHMNSALFEDYYRDSSRIGKADMIAFLQASTAYTLPPQIADCQAELLAVVGSREQHRMKRSAELLAAAAPHARLHVAEGLYHGELSLNHPEAYAELFRRLMSHTL